MIKKETSFIDLKQVKAKRQGTLKYQVKLTVISLSASQQ